MYTTPSLVARLGSEGVDFPRSGACVRVLVLAVTWLQHLTPPDARWSPNVWLPFTVANYRVYFSCCFLTVQMVGGVYKGRWQPL